MLLGTHCTMHATQIQVLDKHQKERNTLYQAKEMPKGKRQKSSHLRADAHRCIHVCIIDLHCTRTKSNALFDIYM